MKGYYVHFNGDVVDNIGQAHPPEARATGGRDGLGFGIHATLESAEAYALDVWNDAVREGFNPAAVGGTLVYGMAGDEPVFDDTLVSRVVDGKIERVTSAVTRATNLDPHNGDDVREAIRRADEAFWRTLATELSLPSGDTAPGELDPYYDAMIPVAAGYVAANAPRFSDDDEQDDYDRDCLRDDIVGDNRWW